MAAKSPTGKARAGFTLTELLVVLFIVGLLATIAVPSVQGAMVRARESALLQNLVVMRKSIDDYYADRGAYPVSLDTLVEQRYLRAIPDDPVAQDDAGWVLEYDQDGAGIVDIRSTSSEVGQNGIAYEDW